MENKHATVDKAVSINIVKGFLMPTENNILTKWLFTVIQKGSFGMYLLETKAKGRLVPVA